MSGIQPAKQLVPKLEGDLSGQILFFFVVYDDMKFLPVGSAYRTGEEFRFPLPDDRISLQEIGDIQDKAIGTDSIAAEGEIFQLVQAVDGPIGPFAGAA